MQHTLPLKEKQIEQTRLEAEAAVQAAVVKGRADAERDRIMADAEANRIRVASAAELDRMRIGSWAASRSPPPTPRPGAPGARARVPQNPTPPLGLLGPTLLNGAGDTARVAGR